MDTLLKSMPAQAAQTAQTTRVQTRKAVSDRVSLLQRYNNYIDSISFSHFGLMAMAILIGSCLGSISAMFVFYSGAPIWVFAIGLFASMANLVTCIAQAPTRWMVNIFLLSVIVNITLLCVYPMV